MKKKSIKKIRRIRKIEDQAAENGKRFCQDSRDPVIPFTMEVRSLVHDKGSPENGLGFIIP